MSGTTELPDDQTDELDDDSTNEFNDRPEESSAEDADDRQGDDAGESWGGSDADDDHFGGSGDDNLVAGLGDDHLEGNDGDDDLNGGHGNDDLIGGIGHDQLHGGAGIDNLHGDDGNDDLFGDDGDDFLDGGSGHDIAHYAANHEDLDIISTAEGYQIQGLTSGIDTLVNIERLQLADTNIALDLEGNAGQVAKILGAVFGASAVHNQSYAGIGLQLMDGGMSYEDLTALAISGTGKSSAQDIVTLLWSNVMGAPPNTTEAEPFIDMLNGGMTTGQLGVLAADFAAVIGVVDLAALRQTGLEYV